jgi:hypothetical protein
MEVMILISITRKMTCCYLTEMAVMGEMTYVIDTDFVCKDVDNYTGH